MDKISNKYIVVFLSIFALIIVTVQLFFVKAIPIICENLSYNSDYIVTIDNPKLYLNIIPVAKIKADKLKIESKKTHDIYQTENLSLTLRILPLLSGRIHINELKTSKIYIKAKLNKDLILEELNPDDLDKLKIKCDYIDLNNIQISVENNVNNTQFTYKAKQIFYENNRRFLKLHIDGALNTLGQIASAKIDLYLPKNNIHKNTIVNADISNIDMSALTAFFKNYIPKDIIGARGIISLKSENNNLKAEFKNLELRYKDEAKTISFPDKLDLILGFELNKKSIIIKNGKIYSKNIDTDFSGEVTNYFSKLNQNLNLKININRLKAEDFINMLPVFKTEDIDSYKLKKYKFYGDVIGNLSIKGDVIEPNINGNVYINNGILTKPIPNAKGATVKLEFKGKYLDFDVNVPAGISEKVWVKGGVELYNVKYSDMRVWSTKNVDLATAEEKVVPIHEILNFVIGPVPIMDIKGKGNIDIIIKGNRKNPHIWGDFNLYNVTTHFYEMPNLILTDADAVLSFNDENAVFNLKKGLINGKTLNIDGNCNLLGKFDFDVKADNQSLSNMYNSIKTSSLVNDIKNMLPELTEIQGLANLKLNLYGSIKDIEDIKFNKNFFTKGSLKLLGNGFEYEGIKLKNTKGIIIFDNTNISLNLNSFIGNSTADIIAQLKDDFVDADISIPKLNLRDIIPNDNKLKKDISDITVKLTLKYKGNVNNIQYDKVDLNGEIINVSKSNKLKLSNGTVTLKNGKLLIKNLNGFFEDTKSSFNLNLQGNNIVSNPVFNGNLSLKNFELSIINSFSEYEFLPQNIRDLIKTVKFTKGKINLDAKISNNSVNTSTNIGGIEFVYQPLEMPVKVVNGSLYIRKNHLGLNKINIMAEEMPILIDGKINNIFDKQDFDIYINSKPKQEFVDKYINNNKIYPLKLKGDIVYSAKLKGIKDNFNTNIETQLAKNSSIYYMGSTIGDPENRIIINIDTNVLHQTALKIKEFSYDKIISSQGNRTTRLNMLKAFGGIELAGNDFILRDLRIKTNNPTDARIFNILFKKPNIKQGQFNSDLKINGKLSNPHVIGSFHIVETNIPFLDTVMKDLSLNFKDKTIDLYSKGEVFGNDIKIKGILRNKLTIPYYIESAELDTKVIDLNYITNKLKSVQVSEETALDSLSGFDIKNLQIKNMNIHANEIRLRNLIASNIQAEIALNEKKDFIVNNFKFNVANGTLNGNYTYNLINGRTSVYLNSRNISANDLAVALFNLNNQIYGDLTGNVKLSCNGEDFSKCMETLNGSIMFNVQDGRMPKLGSLEYLLKAGNLLKGGITNITINSVIDILTPLKTGEFSNIYGTMSVKDGHSDNIEIATKGKDLSLFITGDYNFATAQAEMEVLGLLSKKISTMFGPLGNVSLNTLFNVVPGINLEKNSVILDKINKIPGIELSSKAFRKFIAEINGNINGENYVTSFKWIN